MSASSSPLPTTRPLALLPALTPAATAALDVEPREIIERWLAQLSTGARRSYRRSLATFAKWALADDASPEKALGALCAMTVVQAGECIVRWRDELLASGLASGTVSCYVTGITSLLATCRRAGLVDWRLERVQPKVERRHDRSGPRRGEVERLFGTVDDAAAAGDSHAIRDAALLRLLYCAGLRRSEATNLRLADVDLDHSPTPVVWARRKGNKERSKVGIGDSTAATIRAWLAVRAGDAGGYLFVGRGGGGSSPMNSGSVRRLLAVWAKRAGVKAPCRPHGLRHSAATEIARRGSLAELMAFGGWSSFNAARRYLDERQEERRAAMALVEL